MVIKEEEFKVNEIMMPNIISANPNFTIQEVAKLMDQQKVGSIIVIDNDSPVGIITERDFVVKIVVNSYPSDTKVSEVMSSPVEYVSPDQPVAEVVELMSKKNIRRIPVIDKGKVVGIITGTEFLRLLSRSTNEEMTKLYQKFIERVYSPLLSKQT